MAEKPYGRNRESLADLTVKLEDLFRSQPGVKEQDNGELVLPIRGVTQVLKVFFHENGLDQLSEEDESQFSTIIESNPELELTPTHLLAFVAQLTAANSPPPTPPIKDGSDEDEDDYTLHGRGRASHKLSSAIDSRSSSSDSVGTSRYDRPDKARPPRRIPNSPFENRNRQPRGIADPPSSWSGKRPIPPSKRRRSDAGSNYGSDNESQGGYTRSRRASASAANPGSPTGKYGSSGMVTPPKRQGSVPPERGGLHSRSHSSLDFRIPSNGFRRSPSPDAALFDRFSPPEDSSMPTIGKQSPTPGDDESLDEDPNLVHDQRISIASFTSSKTDATEQLDVLRKSLAEVQRRGLEKERLLQEQLSARELDIEDIQHQLENTREMINTLKRDEKEWRSKERHYVQQINSLEADVNRFQRSLDNIRAQYQTVQKQYADQCAESEKYRNALRTKEAEMHDLEYRETAHEHDINKVRAEHAVMEEQVKKLQAELTTARQTHTDYLGQKQENMILKETIDRLRFDLDDLRSSHANEFMKGSGPGSGKPSLSRSLGSEIARRLQPPDEEADSDNETTVEETTTTQTVEPDAEGDGEEDVYQTIITRKRKVAPKGKKLAIQEKNVVLVDATTQYDSELFAEPEIRVKVEPPSPTPVASTSRQNLYPIEDPPSYHLSELEQSGEETMELLRKWHGVKVLGPLAGGISREAIEDWNSLKQELGIRCPVIEEVIEQSDKQARRKSGYNMPSLSARGESARRYVEGGKRRFYNIYNTYILGGERPGTNSRPESSNNVDIFTAGKWAVAVGAWSVFLLWYGSSGDVGDLIAPGSPTYADRTLWSSFNTLAAGAGEGFGVSGSSPGVDPVGAVWFVVERVLTGASRSLSTRVVFPS